jgi:hypothetical protein
MTDARTALVDGQPIARLAGEPVAVATCADSLHALVLTRLAPGALELWRWRLDDGAVERVIDEAPDGAHHLVAPDGARVFAYDEEAVAIRWRGADGREGAIAPHSRRVVRCAATPDGRHIAIACDREYDPRRGEWMPMRGRVVRVDDGHACFEWTSNEAFAFADDGRALVTVDATRTALVITALDGASRRVELGGVVEPVDVVAERGGTRVALIAAPREVFVCDLAAGRVVAHFWVDDKAALVGFAAGKMVIQARQRGGVRRIVHDVDADTVDALAGDVKAVGPLTPDGDWMARFAAPLLEAVRVRDGRALRLHDGHDAPVVAMAWSHDGAQLATLSSNGVARVWNVSDPSLAWELEDPSKGISLVAFSRDGRLLHAAGSTAVLAWELSSGAEVRRTAHVDQSYPTTRWLLVAPDDRGLLTNCAGRLALIRDDAPAPRPLMLAGEGFGLRHVAFDGDARVRYVVSGYVDGFGKSTALAVRWCDLAGRAVSESRRDPARWDSLVPIDDDPYAALALVDGDLVRADLRDEASFVVLAAGGTYRRIVAARGPVGLVERSDGALVAVGVDDGRERAVLPVARGLAFVALSCDGRYVAVALRDGGVEVFALPEGAR